MKVVLYCRFWNPFWTVPEGEIERLREQFPLVLFTDVETHEEFRHEISDAEIYFGYRLNAEDLALAKELRWIHVPAASVYGLDMKALAKKQIILTNSRGLHATPIAEHVIGCMLVFSRRFMDCWDFQKQKHYAQLEILNQPPPLSELRGKTVLILGLGGIGKEVARISKAFGMRVLACRKRTESSNQAENVDSLFSSDEFRKALPEADYLVMAMPRTEETEGMIGEGELALLKSECVLINVARAGIIQQSALLSCLKQGRIRGAALDVHEKEPLPSDSELFSIPNVFLTPHVAGVSTEDHWPRIMKLFQENLELYLDGKPLKNIVNLELGY